MKSEVQEFQENENGVCPNPFSSENVQPTCESEEDEPQIHVSTEQSVMQTQLRLGDPSGEWQPRTARNSQQHAGFLSVTPRNQSKHALHDTFEPKIALDRANIPRKSPNKSQFPENPAGLKSAATSRVASSTLGSESSYPA